MGFFKHRDNLLEWHLKYDDYLVQITTKHIGQLVPDGLLIASYILFLARYFRICDDRQVQVMKEFLNKEIGASKSDINYLPRKINDLIEQTLNERQKHAVDQFPMGEPPYAFTEDDVLTKSYAHYSFLVFEQVGSLTSTFHMSLGWDIIFLPLTVGILYNHVCLKLGNIDKKEILDKAILDLLRAYDHVNCRSYTGLIKLPIEIINKNNIDYKQ